METEELTNRVRVILAQDYVGGRLQDATKAVTDGLIRNFPEILTEDEDKETFEELVWDAAAREGY